MFNGAAMVLTHDPTLYRDLMRFKPEGVTPNAWAVKAGVSRTVWSDMRRHGNPSRRTLEKLLAAANSSLAEFEALRVGSPALAFVADGSRVGDATAASWRARPLPPVPLYRTAEAGTMASDPRIELVDIDFSKVHGTVARPVSLAGDRQAYAVTMAGKAMWPRFRAGRQLIVSPAAAFEAGDDVLIQLAGNDEEGKAVGLIRELVRQSDSAVELRQFNPDLTFEVPVSAIAQIHKVLGEAI